MRDISTIPERRLTKAKYWMDIINGHKDTGLPINKYCQQRGVNPSTFYYWSNYLEGKSSAPSTIVHKNKLKSSKNGNSKFVAVKLKPQNSYIEELTTPEERAATQKTLCTLRFPSGISLKVHDIHILHLLFEKII